MEESSILLQLKNVAWQAGATQILNNICFDLRAGEFKLITGQSGCGKSTLLKIVASLISPSSGEILFETAMRQARCVAGADDAGALRRRRAALLAFSDVYGVCNRMRDGDCSFPVRQNNSDFSLEVRNHRAFRLRGVCLPKQPVQSAQHSHADAHPNDTDRAVVLPAGVYRL